MERGIVITSGIFLTWTRALEGLWTLTYTTKEEWGIFVKKERRLGNSLLSIN
jgi:hypothetical protein